MKLMDLPKRWRDEYERLIVLPSASASREARIYSDCADALEAAIREQAEAWNSGIHGQLAVGNTFEPGSYNEGVALGCAKQLRWCARDLLATTEGGE